MGKNILTVCVSHIERINPSIKLFNGVVKSLQVSHNSWSIPLLIDQILQLIIINE